MIDARAWPGATHCGLHADLAPLSGRADRGRRAVPTARAATTPEGQRSRRATPRALPLRLRGFFAPGRAPPRDGPSFGRLMPR
eukprot:scaffold996_cov409-Prasinococcus_capsulatus_cf.AAC.3